MPPVQNAVIDGAYRNGVKKLLFLGSSCIYPKFAKQPMAESELLTGALEPTNEWCAVVGWGAGRAMPRAAGAQLHPCCSRPQTMRAHARAQACA